MLEVAVIGVAVLCAAVAAVSVRLFRRGRPLNQEERAELLEQALRRARDTQRGIGAPIPATVPPRRRR